MRTLLLLVVLFTVGAAHAAPRYVLQIGPGGGEVRVVVGQKLLRFDDRSARSRTVNDLLKVGANAIRIGWSNIIRPAEVILVRLEGKDAQILLRYRIDGVLRPRNGAVNLAVVRNDDPRADVTLSALISKGLVRVELNGRSVGDFASLERRDITPFLKRGLNTLVVQWSKDFGSSLPRARLTLRDGDGVLVDWNGADLRTLSGQETVRFEY